MINTMMKIFTVFVVFTLSLSDLAMAGEKPKFLTVGHMDFDKPPYYHRNGTGLDLKLVRMAAERIGIDVTFTALPWRRCQALLEKNKLDGILGASFTETRMKIARYPLTSEGKTDNSAALHLDGYSFYKRLDDPFDYDGERFINLTGLIGANSGFSIVKKLKTRGIAVDDNAKTTERNLKKLVVKRLQVVVDGGIRVDYYLKNHPELLEKIVKVSTPYELSGRFFIVSRGFYQQYPGVAEQLWATIKEIRESEAFQKMTKEAWQ